MYTCLTMTLTCLTMTLTACPVGATWVLAPGSTYWACGPAHTVGPSAPLGGTEVLHIIENEVLHIFDEVVLHNIENEVLHTFEGGVVGGGSKNPYLGQTQMV